MTRPKGFTLLEIAVALAILGVGVVTCLEIFGGSLRLQERAAREPRCVLHARAAMDQLLFQREIKNHSEQSDNPDGCHVEVLVRDAGPDDGVDKKQLDLQSDVSLRYLEVAVAWQDGLGAKHFTLRSLREAPPAD